MTMNWPRFGQKLKAARVAKKLKQRELADLVGVSVATVQAIEGGASFARITLTVRALARAVGWQEGSEDVVLAGGDPVYVSVVDASEQLEIVDQDAVPGEPEGDGGDDWAERIPLRIQEEVREGRVLDSGTYDLSETGSDVQLLVMIKAPSSATPEEIREYMRLWRRTERELRELERRRKSAGDAPDSNPQ